MTRLIGLAGLLVFGAFQAFGQQATRPEFEAASIKPFEAVQAANGSTYMGGPCTLPNPGTLSCHGTSLRMLVARAYGIQEFRVFGPDWLDSARFEIQARIPDAAKEEQVSQMIQKLLEDRFHMKVHRETREMPNYALMVDRNGPKLKEFKETSDSSKRPGSMRQGFTSEGLTTVEAYGWKASWLAAFLTRAMNQIVVDQTDLKGDYEIRLSYVPGEGMQKVTKTVNGVPVTEEPAGGPTIFSALQSQLGLKLEMKKLPTETIVVDSADRTPTMN
jgi:uncharacterized protein (TIGR03435 family)